MFAGILNCRTVSTDQDTFNVVPEGLIIQAGLLAAAELFKE